MTYLLDSNVWIGLIRQTSPQLAAKFRSLAPTADICVCSVVPGEFWYGCRVTGLLLEDWQTP
jgi:predicted nucleic acid-binding protein